MTPKQLKQLKALLAKAEGDRNEDEVEELKRLQTLATKSGWNPETGEPADLEDGDTSDLDPDEARKMIREESIKATEGVLKAIGLDEDGVKAIKDSLDKEDELTADKITEIVKESGKASQDIDVTALIETVTKSVQAAAERKEATVSPEDLKKFGEDLEKKMAKSRIQFPEDPADIEFPIEGRKGNLSVAQKQLLNLCLMEVGEKGLEDSDGGRGIKRPESMWEGISPELKSRALKAGNSRMEKIRMQGAKALTTSGSGSGAELIPTDLSSDMMSRLYLQSELARELIASEMDMPTNSFEIPLRTTRTQFYVGSENPASNPTASNYGTGKVTLTAQKLIGRAIYSYEADEDSIIAMLPSLQQDMAEGAADAFEGAVINGDTSATHMDTDIHAVTDHHAKLFPGLRFYAKDNALACGVDWSTSGFSYSNIKAVKKFMKKWGLNARDLIWIVGVNGKNYMDGLDEVVTVDKFGDGATVLTGSVSSIGGVRIVTSSQVREDLNDAAVYDGVTTTKGSAFLMHKPSWHIGVRRGFTVEVDRDISKQNNTVVASFRRDLKPKETPTAALPLVGMGYKWTA